MASNPPRKLGLTRQQIAKIVDNDFEAIRAFERLFTVGEVSETTNTVIAQLAELAAYAPLGAPDTDGPALSTIDWSRFAPYVPIRGRMGWEPIADTLGLGVGDSGVLLRIGFDKLACVVNTSGAAMTRGQVVRVVGAITNALDVELFTADGVQEPYTVVGLLSQDLANGQQGYATAFGTVQRVDTSAFALGDILFADGVTPGALTTTAPTEVVPIGVVVAVGTTDGAIWVNPCCGSGGGGGGGGVTSVATAGTVNGITLTGGPITTTGTVTLGGTLSGVDLATQTSGNLAASRGGVPTGGTTGQALVKSSNTDYDVAWATGSAGSEAISWAV
jgi:hypothetical protein